MKYVIIKCFKFITSYERKGKKNMRYGLIGEKLGHSFSKVIHEELADYTYDLKPLSRTEVGAFLKKKEFKAINVTIPYKEFVMPYLQHIDEKAKKIGAVNTVVHHKGELFGYNTDYDGFLYMLENNKIDVEGKKAFVLGKGGAAKACIAVLKDLKAEVYCVYHKEFEGTITYQEAIKKHQDVEIIVNTTPVGMYPNDDKSPIDLEPFTKLEAVLDVIYNPLKTKLLLDAQDKGLKIVGGLEMLVAQAKVAVEIFQNTKIDDKRIQEIFEKIRNEKRNIVLIGMSGCGKTYVGERIQERSGKKFVDSDKEIIAQTKKPIVALFEERGEAGFRAMEKEMIKNLSQKNGLVISTGGGVIKDPENIHQLRKNGVLIWLKRDVDFLQVGDSRPLAKTKKDMIALYEKRLPIYEASCDFVIYNNHEWKESMNEILKKYQTFENVE